MSLQAAGEKENRYLRKTAWSAVWVTISLIVLGGAVRATDSGLSCPDWPYCFGKVLPPFDYHVFLEWLHRAVGGIVTILFCAVATFVFRDRGLRGVFFPQILLSAALLSTQVVLGGLTVLKLLDPQIVSLHLANALLFFAIILAIALKCSVIENRVSSISGLGWQSKALISCIPFVAYVQIILGGAVSSHHAGLACPDFPTCHGTLWPAEGLQLQLQMLHRYGAFALLVYAAIVNRALIRTNLPSSIRVLLRALPSLMLMQITLGLVNIKYQLPVWASVAHLALAITIFAISLYATLRIHLGITGEHPQPRVSPIANRHRQFIIVENSSPGVST